MWIIKRKYSEIIFGAALVAGWCWGAGYYGAGGAVIVFGIIADAAIRSKIEGKWPRIAAELCGLKSDIKAIWRDKQ